VASGRGKRPSLTVRGCYVLALCLVLLIVGVGCGSWSLAAMALAVHALLLTSYLGFAGNTALLWRRHLELVWWLPRSASSEGLVALRPFAVQVTLRNISPVHLGFAELRVFASRCVEWHSQLPPLSLRAGGEAKGTIEMKVAQAGQWFVHGAAVRMLDRLGLYTVEAYFPSALRLKVLPRQQPRAVLPVARVSGGAAEQRLGAHTLRQRGLGGELRELREYVPGDPFKLIAWKATARAPFGRPLVRELERETMLTHYILLDIGVSMREGQPGQWKLDHALELCASYARSVLDNGDRVALIAFDATIFRHLRPGDGPPHRLKLIERLLDTMNVVDESFVAMTDGELCAAVARYLRQQEGIDVRVRRAPPMDDLQEWAKIAVAPTGERYHLPQLVQAAQRLLAASASGPDSAPGAQAEVSARLRSGSGPSSRPSMPPSSSSGLRTASPALPPVSVPMPGAGPGAGPGIGPGIGNDLALLRRLCLLRGIELPYGQRSAAGRAQGLASALEQAAGTPGAQVVLISDLLGLVADNLALTRAVALCRRRGLRLLCIRPEARRYLPKDLLAEPATARAADIFSWEQSRQEAHMHRALAQLGFHVVAVGPEDGLAQILGRTSSIHSTSTKSARVNQSSHVT
jgi:uncharacterized protein (DUF58 family)